MVSEGGMRELYLYPQKRPKTFHLIVKNVHEEKLLVQGLTVFGKSKSLQ